jgi:CBS domain containing-hemolysin-like protein
MAELAISLARLLVAFFLVALNGFFVASEFAFVRVRSTAVEQLVEEGRPGSATLQDVVAGLDDYLATTQLGITIASLGLGWAGEPAVAALIEPVLGSFAPAGVVHFVAFAVGFGFITFLHVVFGELAPKTIAIQRAERVALLVAPPMKLCYYLFVPGIVVFNGTANFFTRIVGVQPASETEETLQEDELRMVLSRSGQQGHVDMAEVEMIERVFELDDTPVREVMVPHPDVVSVPADLPLSELRSVILEAEHTRYPVVESDHADRVVGYLDVKDVLRAGERGDDVTAGELAREVLVVPESTLVNDLLGQFREERCQMAAVIDEWGAFEGIATVEDVVEVVVGDLKDEFDAAEQEPSIDRRGPDSYEVDGAVSLTRLNERLDADFESDEFESVGGLLLDELGRAPAVGDRVEAAGYALTVEAVDGARVSRVLVENLPEEASENATGE